MEKGNKESGMALQDKDGGVRLNHTAWTRKTERRTCPACKATEWISPLEMVETERICPVCEESLSTEIDPMLLESIEELAPRICD